ncbi:hypothetical protein E4Z66_04365 [Aliishimia ponticola]|uniref:Sulfotransferase family protein n=1 Tax=Aliishimia ponticola TaxID=2499833 RepID=A0A4S4NRF5_9RHOB|nr:hypothetical protein [Aliishimia ponticola]THH38800.1 hypothetical protein E4Z66_04365 [Aliishimia ponticola]
MILTDFAHTGFALHLATDQPITRYQVLGERSSGTNFAKRLLGRNTDLKPTEALGWKHGFPHALAIPPDLLVIGVVRSAKSWALSMHAKPWHAGPDLQALPLSDFLRAPWDSYVDRPRYFDGAAAAGIVGQPLQYDRHPLTGARFDNLFALRRAKLAGLLSYAERGCNFALLRMEDMTAQPEATLDKLLSALPNSKRAESFRPVIKRLGSKFKPAIPARPDTPKALSEDDLDFLRAETDKTQEAILGYTY